MLEFTGERVIPGAVEPDLFNEHFARYAFGARLTKGKRVLDAGCGDGYGAAELARDASQVIGLDLSGEAVAHARARYAAPNLEFRQGACASLPFPEACFDLVVAFEVIEHLDDPRALVAEARRVLAPGGAFLVSTPNKTVYAKTRGDFGPNPFHVREFDLAEFEAELGALFPHVRIFQQVDVSAILFGPAVALEARLDASPALSEEAHFFLGVCSASPLESIPGFLYLPRAGNLLHSRQRHIELLEADVARTRELLDQCHRWGRDLERELELRGRWGRDLERELELRGARVLELQQELAGQQAAAVERIAALEREVAGQAEAGRRVVRELEQKCRELADCVELLDRAEATVVERSAWAQRAQASADLLAQQVALFRGSRWAKLGRALGLGPRLG